MTKHEIKTCPKCTRPFECKTGDILNCQCQSVKLTQQHRDYIFEQFDECLCASCMRKLRSECNMQHFNIQIQQLMIGK